MRRFTELFGQLDRTTRKNAKLDALRRYFAEADPGDAAWALSILSGRKLMRALPTRELRTWLCEEAGIAPWLLGECYEAVGDFSETLSLLAPCSSDGTDLPLKTVIEEHLLPLRQLAPEAQRAGVVSLWKQCTREQCFLLHKLISGHFRVGVAATTTTQALADVAGIPAALMAHRLLGDWRPNAEDYRKLLSAESPGDSNARPYPFFLAHPLLDEPATLGPPDAWRAEWKWDGIRAQLIHRGNETLLWSRGEEIISPAFPELIQAGQRLPDGTVLDAELLGWENERPLPFAALQKRLNRKQVPLSFWPEVPVRLMVFDLLEADGVDLRSEPLTVRRARLEALLRAADDPLLQRSEEVAFEDWAALGAARATARQRGVEGVMLKRADAPYGVGRPRGDWWKWKVDPLTIDTVMLYAQRGSGRRASLYTDYTFGVWDGKELVTIAKAYSGLSDEEIKAVDRFVRQNTLERHGPLRRVEPTQVFELACDHLQESDRHKSGIALRFPRIARWRTDKLPEQADTLQQVRALLEQQHG